MDNEALRFTAGMALDFANTPSKHDCVRNAVRAVSVRAVSVCAGCCIICVFICVMECLLAEILNIYVMGLVEKSVLFLPPVLNGTLVQMISSIISKQYVREVS